MQLKSLLLLTLPALLASKAFTQQRYESFTMQSPAKVIRTDTIIQKKGTTIPAPAALAANMPVKPGTEANAATSRYKPVPLAGHKAYYGNMNDYVKKFVRQYFSAHNKTLTVVKGRCKTRFSLMENVLQKHDIPKELKYLAVIESALNNKAVSHAGAVGPWQLMTGTAQLLGLTVNSKRDDRTDWYKSTNAAAKYLKQLYGQLNDWLLVVAAYNSGPVPVQRAIDRTGSRSFWDIKKHLPRETQGHVLAFIATATIFENLSNLIGMGAMPSDASFGDEDPSVAKDAVPVKPQFTEEELKSMAIVRISEPISIDFMAQTLAIDKKLLAKWNEDYDLFLFGTYDKEYYSLRIPKDKLDGFIDKKDYITRISQDIFKEMDM